MNSELTFKKLKSTFVVAVFMILMMITLNKYFSGIVIAKLPFIPFRLISGLTHRGIEGEDYTECSFIFIYILTGMIFKNNIEKIFDLKAPPNPYNPWE